MWFIKIFQELKWKHKLVLHIINNMRLWVSIEGVFLLNKCKLTFFSLWDNPKVWISIQDLMEIITHMSQYTTSAQSPSSEWNLVALPLPKKALSNTLRMCVCGIKSCKGNSCILFFIKDYAGLHKWIVSFSITNQNSSETTDWQQCITLTNEN